jgi:hypothetical protein
MKKLIYSLAMVLVGLTSCTSFDDPTTENYGAGPSVDVTITAGTPSDSAFTVVITPSAGSLYYAYAIGQSTAPQAIDSTTLYKGGYGNSVIKVADKATTTINITDADPNTTYYVYAVAGSDKGIVGNMTVKGITTTDVLSPGPKTIQKDEDNAAVKLTFSEAIQRGEGAVTALYYKEWDILRPVEVPAEDLTVQVSGSSVIFAADNIPAGAYVCFSYEAGAFKDGKGNPCRALNSGLNDTTGEFSGAWVHVTNVPFEIDDDQVTAPEDGAIISNVEDFKGEITLDEDIYRNDETVEDGDLSVTYTSDSRVVTYKLTADQWSVSGNKINFVLPATPENGDYITFSMVEGAVTDVLGNPNAEYTSSAVWKYSTFKPTVADVLGTFNYAVTLKSNSKTYDLGNFTISEYTGEDAEPGDVVISDLYMDGSKIYGYYDLETAQLYIQRYQALGTYVEEGVTYGVVTYSMAGQKQIVFDITADGLVSTDFALAYTDAEFSSLLGYEVPEGLTVFAKAAGSRMSKAAKTAKNKKSNVVKNLKGTPRKVKAVRSIRK